MNEAAKNGKGAVCKPVKMKQWIFPFVFSANVLLLLLPRISLVSVQNGSFIFIIYLAQTYSKRGNSTRAVFGTCTNETTKKYSYVYWTTLKLKMKTGNSFQFKCYGNRFSRTSRKFDWVSSFIVSLPRDKGMLETQHFLSIKIPFMSHGSNRKSRGNYCCFQLQETS